MNCTSLDNEYNHSQRLIGFFLLWCLSLERHWIEINVLWKPFVLKCWQRHKIDKRWHFEDDYISNEYIVNFGDINPFFAGCAWKLINLSINKEYTLRKWQKTVNNTNSLTSLTETLEFFWGNCEHHFFFLRTKLFQYNFFTHQNRQIKTKFLPFELSYNWG